MKTGGGRGGGRENRRREGKKIKESRKREKRKRKGRREAKGEQEEEGCHNIVYICDLHRRPAVRPQLLWGRASPRQTQV